MQRKTKVHLWLTFHVAVIVVILFGLGAVLFLYNAANDPCAYYSIRHKKLGIHFEKGLETTCPEVQEQIRQLEKPSFKVAI